MTDSSSLSLSVATYNIHSCIGTDRQFAPARIAEVIDDLDADIVALQEVGWHLRRHPGFNQFEFFKQHTDYHVYPGLVRHHRYAHFGNALLTKQPIEKVRQIDLSVDYRAPRGAIDAEMQVNGSRLRIINVHLGLDPWERHIQFNRLLEMVKHGPTETRILLGDFNEWRLEFPPFRELKSYFPNCLAPRTFHTRRPLLRYDRIYASEDLQFTDSEVRATPQTRRASDHLPVCSRVSRATGARELHAMASGRDHFWLL